MARSPVRTVVTLGAAVVVTSVALWVGHAVWELHQEAPMGMDAGQLDPLLEGTEIVVPPTEDCPPGREHNPCDAGAVVGGRASEQLLDVIAENARESGYVEGADRDPWLYVARRRDTCLTVDDATSPDILDVRLSWC